MNMIYSSMKSMIQDVSQATLVESVLTNRILYSSTKSIIFRYRSRTPSHFIPKL